MCDSIDVGVCVADSQSNSSHLFKCILLYFGLFVIVIIINNIQYSKTISNKYKTNLNKMNFFKDLLGVNKIGIEFVTLKYNSETLSTKSSIAVLQVVHTNTTIMAKPFLLVQLIYKIFHFLSRFL